MDKSPPIFISYRRQDSAAGPLDHGLCRREGSMRKGALVGTGAAVLGLSSLGCGLDVQPLPSVELDGSTLLSYEVIPSTDIVPADCDYTSVGYETREVFTQQMLEDYDGQIMAILGLDIPGFSVQVTPGGCLLETNPSLQASALIENFSHDSALELAAAYGLVYQQASVSVTDFDHMGTIAYASVQFETGALDAALAQEFFEHANSIADGLGEGYTAFGDSMFFINLAPSGAPDSYYSNLVDEVFRYALSLAVDEWTGAAVELVQRDSDDLSVVSVENDWAEDPNGSAFSAYFDEAELAALTDLQAQFRPRALELGSCSD